MMYHDDADVTNVYYIDMSMVYATHLYSNLTALAEFDFVSIATSYGQGSARTEQSPTVGRRRSTLGKRDRSAVGERVERKL